MKKLLLTTAISSLLASSSALAVTQPGSFYLSVEGGMGFLSDVELNKSADKYELDKDFFFGGEFGYNISEQMRAGVAIQYHFEPEFKKAAIAANNDTDTEAVPEMVRKYSAKVALAKVAFDAYRTEELRLSIVAGAGVNYMNGEFNTGESTEKTVNQLYFAAQGGVEVSYEINPGMYAKVGAGYTNLTISKIMDAEKEDGKVLFDDEDKLSGVYGLVGVSFDF